MVKEQRILRSRRKMGDPLDTREERRRRRENGTQDIVGYEIGSGYGPLNDDAENVASRRRWRFVTTAGCSRRIKRFCLYFEDHESGTSQREAAVSLSLSFSLSLVCLPFSTVFPRFMLCKRSSRSALCCTITESLLVIDSTAVALRSHALEIVRNNTLLSGCLAANARNHLD